MCMCCCGCGSALAPLCSSHQQTRHLTTAQRCSLVFFYIFIPDVYCICSVCLACSVLLDSLHSVYKECSGSLKTASKLTEVQQTTKRCTSKPAQTACPRFRGSDVHVLALALAPSLRRLLSPSQQQTRHPRPARFDGVPSL